MEDETYSEAQERAAGDVERLSEPPTKGVCQYCGRETAGQAYCTTACLMAWTAEANQDSAAGRINQDLSRALDLIQRRD